MKVINKLELLIMIEISTDLTRRWSINELATQMGKHYRPIHAAVQGLIDLGMLARNNNRLIEPTFSDTIILELAERARSDEIKDKDIRIISGRLAQIPSSFFSAVLFGSSVTRKGKDIDILLMIPDCEDTDKFRDETTRMLGSFAVRTDLNVVHEHNCHEMLNKANEKNVMNEILRNHVVLIGAENFYRVIRRWKDS